MGNSEVRKPQPEISILVPLYNEMENVKPLLEELRGVMGQLGRRYEIVLVDDGSTDGTAAAMASCLGEHPHVKAVFLRRNYGQTAALAAAIEHSSGEILIPMDGDLQNDPHDIRTLIEYLDKGYDVVSGWRKNRKDTFITRTLPSRLANGLISTISGVHLHDYGCTLKAYKREMLKPIKLLGEMHRFIPVLASWEGARVTEVVVSHRPRTRGKSKYGLFRTFKVVLDLITVKFLVSFITKPIYVFGGTGAVLGGLSAFLAIYSLYQKLRGGVWIHKNPLFLIAIFFGLAGLQFLLMGLLGELMARIYFETGRRSPYTVREIRESSCAESPASP